MANTFSDYYKILGVEPGATAMVIKKAWRERVRVTHPDVKRGEAQEIYSFQEIQEAYETLSDPIKKEKYLQQRWLQQVYRSKPLAAPSDAYAILQAMIAFEKKVNRMDSYRLDTDFIKQTVLFLLAPSSIALLNTANDTILNQQITDRYLQCLTKLPFGTQQELLKNICRLNDVTCQQKVKQYVASQQYRWALEKYQIALAAVVVALLCCLISWLA